MKLVLQRYSAVYRFMSKDTKEILAMSRRTDYQKMEPGKTWNEWMLLEIYTVQFSQCILQCNVFEGDVVKQR